MNYTGLGNYSRMIVRAMMNTYSANEYYLYSPKLKRNAETEEFMQHPECVRSAENWPAFLRSFWRTYRIGKKAREDQLDIYHGLSHELPNGLSNKIKAVVTMHDLIFLRYPELYSVIDRRVYTQKCIHACQRADKVVAISEQTKRDLIAYLKVPEEKITVVYQGCAKQFSEPAGIELKERVKLKYDLPECYLLTVGTMESRKNLLILLKALKVLPQKIGLVAVGRSTDYFRKEILPYAEKEKLGKRIRFIHKARYEELPAIYQQASLFLYPSRFEGFGIPILEALNSQLPVIAATGSCLEEAGGENTIYIDPDDAQGLVVAIKRVCEDGALRKKMIEKGLVKAAEFEESRVAGAMMNVYQSIL